MRNNYDFVKLVFLAVSGIEYPAPYVDNPAGVGVRSSGGERRFISFVIPGG